jgi:hypothetical protein
MTLRLVEERRFNDGDDRGGNLSLSKGQPLRRSPTLRISAALVVSTSDPGPIMVSPTSYSLPSTTAVMM